MTVNPSTDKSGSNGSTQAGSNGKLTIWEYVQRYYAAGLSFLPIRRNGSKAPHATLLPDRKWEGFQVSPPTEAQARRWFDRPIPVAGPAIICGRVSGNLEMIDFDQEASTSYPEWRELVEAQCPGLVERLTVVRTPRPGFQVVYRCPDTIIPGNTKLAEDPTKKGKERTLIETRGEGGYFLTCGCPADCHPTKRTYDHFAGPELHQVQSIAAGEREVLLQCARLFDRKPKQEKNRGGAPRPGEGLRPGDDFNQRVTWEEILEPASWRKIGERNGKTLWVRPGKEERGWSATTGYCKGEDGTAQLYVFSSNAAPFEQGESYSRFAAYTLLNHNGDYKAAAKALAANGDGTKRASKAAHGTTDNQAWSDGRPEIEIGVDEMRVNDEAIAALKGTPNLYQRANMLVHVLRDESRERGIFRPQGSPRIAPLPSPRLREFMADRARWVAISGTGENAELRPAHPPKWSVDAVAARGSWRGISHLEAVVECPTLRPDGTVLDVAGWDPVTGLLYEPRVDFPRVPETPCHQQAEDAADRLLDLVRDFPFAGLEHHAVRLAALLTPLGRWAFAGPAPLFLFVANCPGTGKTLLPSLIA
jgi:hypothetical protein